MNRKTLKALRASIKHWERMAKNPSGSEQPTALHCDLCRLFQIPEPEYTRKCNGCPIKEKTGVQFCNLTPFNEASRAYWGNLPEFPAHAREMIDFLKSLLPKPTRKKP